MLTTHSPHHNTLNHNVYIHLHSLIHIIFQLEDPDNSLSTSSAQLPADIDEVREQTFVPPASQRGEGQPSAALRAHLGIGTARREGLMDPDDQERVHEMMFRLSTWFFSIDTLGKIANYTNDKATELVYKTRHRDVNNKVYYKVHTHMFTVHHNACYHSDMDTHAGA
jgi:hypothetical protein